MGEIKKKDEHNEVFESKSIVNTLHSLMNEVTKKECNSDTVNAACNCASRITELLKLHLEVEKFKFKAKEKGY
jgi:hypothetical protein